MMRCRVCGSFIDEPSVYHYIEDMNGEGALQDFYIDYCPFCGSEELDTLPDLDDDLTAEESARMDKQYDEEQEWRICHE